MNIRQIDITNYKNHHKIRLFFEKNVVCVVGMNGVGKTNVLDAIHFLCVGKSYFSSLDKYCVCLDDSFFRLEAKFENNDEVQIVFEQGKQKKIWHNEMLIKKLSNYLGNFPIVVIAPDDNVLILGGSEERRKFINQTLVQTDIKYFTLLKMYNKILQQRNALLKSAYQGNVDKNLLSIYDEKLKPLNKELFIKRKQFVEELKPHLAKAYQFIAEKEEAVAINYQSPLLKNEVEQGFEQTQMKDIVMKRTHFGVHKDDLQFSMHQQKLKNLASQGQQKTFLLALKLAQYFYLKEKLQKPLIFVIDDIFDKLDSKRSENLIKFVCRNLDQVFISHTNKELLTQRLENFDFQLIEL